MGAARRRKGHRLLESGQRMVCVVFLAIRCGGGGGGDDAFLTNEGPPRDAGLPTQGAGPCPVMGGVPIEVPAAPTPKTVTITVGQSVGGQVLSHGLTVLNADTGEAGRCAAVFQDGCVVRDCRVPEPQLGDLGETLPATSLGGVAVVDGPTEMGAVFAVTPRARGSYLPAREDGVRWGANDAVCVRGAGAGALGPFQAGVTFPQPLREVLPVVPDPVNEIVHIQRGAPLLVRWAPTSERVVVSLNQRAANGTTPTWMEDLSISCEFDGAAGRAEVPVSVLRRFLSAAEGNSSGSLYVGSVRATAFRAGDHPVIVRAVMGASFRAEYH